MASEKTISILSLHSLFSTIITLYILILLYFPSLFLQFISPPTLILTIILLFSILRLGKTQCYTPEEKEFDSSEFNSCRTLSQDHKAESELSSKCEPDPLFNAGSFVEWDVRAPLEVIYEEEAEQNDGVFEDNRKFEMNIIQRYGSLSLFYPESDSDDSSAGDSPTIGVWKSLENVIFPWEAEGCDRDSLIEIALDDQTRCSEVDDEDNLIEIDISPAR